MRPNSPFRPDRAWILIVWTSTIYNDSIANKVHKSEGIPLPHWKIFTSFGFSFKFIPGLGYNCACTNTRSFLFLSRMINGASVWTTGRNYQNSFEAWCVCVDIMTFLCHDLERQWHIWPLPIKNRMKGCSILVRFLSRSGPTWLPKQQQTIGWSLQF